jgi:4-amino-4-deoxy-L-arabinose transferase-like glycosyltransferase
MSLAKYRYARVSWIVFCLAIFTHVIYLARDHNYFGNDTPSYLVPADNLLHGQGFVNSLHQPELYRTPGYPFVLALFRISPFKVESLILVQHGLCILLAVAVAAVALKLSGSSLVALVAGAVLAFDLATVRIANLLLTEIVFTALISVVCWILYRGVANPTGNMLASAAAGLLAGLAVLVRPVGILYFVPLSVYLLLVLRRHALRPILILTASFLLFPLLWATRNYVEAGYFGISTAGAQDLLAYRAAGALAVRQPGNYLDNVLKQRERLLAQACDDLKRMYQRDCISVPEPQRASYAVSTGEKLILTNLSGYLRSTLLGLAYTVFGGGAEAVSKMSNLDLRRSEFVVLLITLPEASLAVIGCWYWYRRDRNLCYLLMLTVVYFLLISAGGEAYSRFKVPVMPMYALLIGGGAAAVVHWIQRGWTFRLAQADRIATGS